MLAMFLKILSILGIILLVLLAIIVVLLLIVLFMPIVYKIDAAKNETEMKVNAKARWLFGFLRANYSYPEPGRVIVKVLWITLYDSGQNDKKKEPSPSENDRNKKQDEVSEGAESKDANTEEIKGEATKAEGTKTEEPQGASNTSSDDGENTDSDMNSDEDAEKKGLKEKVFAKYEKIKYTIKQFYDKIKHVVENITFYKDLLQNEETKLLLSHLLKRIGKILCHICPGKVKADVLFGTGSPDTTGYAYGVYGMVSPKLGKDVIVTPDFSQQIFQGTISAKGHITIFTILVNALAVILDRRLHRLIAKIKAHSGKPEQREKQEQK